MCLLVDKWQKYVKYFVPALIVFLNDFQMFMIAGGVWYGVNILKEDISDNFESCVWEPAIVKINAITAASEATCLILSVDETIKNPKAGGDAPGGPGMGRGRGRPM